MNAVSFTLAPWAAFSRQLVAQWCRTGSQVRDRRLWRGSVGYSQVKDGLEVRPWLGLFFFFTLSFSPFLSSYFVFFSFIFCLFIFLHFLSDYAPLTNRPLHLLKTYLHQPNKEDKRKPV